MLCSIYKWEISRAMDSGKPLSGKAKRHLRRCSACRQFARLSKELGRRLTEEAAVLLENHNASLGEKVLSSLDGRVESPAFPRRGLLKPVLAAAGLLVTVSVSIIWLVTPRSEKMPQLDSLLKFDAAAAYLEKAMQKAESPYEAEIQELKKALRSSAEVLEASFSIGLGGKTQ
jgi:hypothetical protein